jgi:hypothetical protein
MMIKPFKAGMGGKLWPTVLALPKIAEAAGYGFRYPEVGATGVSGFAACRSIGLNDCYCLAKAHKKNGIRAAQRLSRV